VTDYTGSVNTQVTLKSDDIPSTDIHSTSMTNQITLIESNFKDADADVANSHSWRVSFDSAETASSSLAAVGYYWQVRSPIADEQYPSTIDRNFMYQHWMPEATVTLQRANLGTQESPTGQMLFGDLSTYEPLWSIDTHYLDESNRRFIEYGTWSSGAPTGFANPVSFQADSYGSGVVTYGLSQMISQEHAWYNISISESYMDYISKVYHMNMWGHTRLDDVVESVSMDYSVEDRLELWNQEGSLDEAYGTLLKGTYGVVNTIQDWLSPYQTSSNDAGAFTPTGYDADVWNRLGNGKLDSFIEKTAVDYDGADWFVEGQYRDDTNPNANDWTVATDTIWMHNDTMLVRPSLMETSDWDSDDPQFDLIAPGLEWAMADGTILRHQLLRGQKITLDLDWSGLDVGSEVYVTIQIDLAGIPYWVNRTIVTSANSEPIIIDLGELTNRLSGETSVPIWFSNNQTMTTVPVISVWAYNQTPSTITDFVSMIRNLLYADVFYLKMEYDESYLHTYYSQQSRLQEEGESMKKWLALMGAAMVGVGVLTAPVGGGVMILWGSDMIVSTMTGKSLFDHLIHGGMHLSNSIASLVNGTAFNEDYIDNFSFWQMTSNKGVNLLLTEAAANALSFGLGRAGGMISARLAQSTGSASSAVARTLKLGSREGAARAGLLSRAWGKIAGRFPVLQGLTQKIGSNAALKIAGKAVREYYELLGEVIFEMAFDNMLRFNKEERPMGGGETFLITMSVAVVVSGLLQSVGGSLDIGVDDNGIKQPWSKLSIGQKAARVAIRSLLFTSLALAVSMYMMRMPVMDASSA